MLLRAVRYGIDLGFGTVSVRPFGLPSPSFSYHINEVDVDFDPAKIKICVPGQGLSNYSFGMLRPGDIYTISVEERRNSSSFPVPVPVPVPVDSNLASRIDGCLSTASFASFDVAVDTSGELKFSAPIGRSCMIVAMRKAQSEQGNEKK